MVAPPLFTSHLEHASEHHEDIGSSPFARSPTDSIKDQPPSLCGANLGVPCDGQSECAQPRYAPHAAHAAQDDNMGETDHWVDALTHSSSDEDDVIALNGQVCLDKFEKLVDDIKLVLGPTKGIDDIDVDHLMEIMKQYDPCSCEDEWNKYALNDPTRNYTRNGVDDINNKANLLILVWNPERGSMIHDHANAHCIVKLLKGQLRETLYEWPSRNNEELVEKKVTDVHVGQVTYMSDNIGLHRMYNPHKTDVAVSMHLYTPPYAAKFGCHIYDQESGKSHKVDMSTLYSNKGIRCGKPGDTC